MTVSVYVASHPDDLVSVLCDQLAEPPDDPFARELVAVPSRGIERWITQRLAAEFAERGIGDGVCANIDFPSPHELVHNVLGAVPELAAAVTGWAPSSLTTHVLAAIDTHLEEPWLRLFKRYLGDDETSQNRLPAAVKIPRLFSIYANRCPDMIRSWAGGGNVGPGGEPIATGGA